MSRPVHFNGIEYANAEAMPPDVRAAYEQSSEQDKQSLAAKLAARQAQTTGSAEPAWGGPRAAGGVPVPQEFDPVTMLGPAKAVHEHDGIRLIPSFGTPHPNVLVIYRDGLAFRAGKELHPWRWEEVAAIQSNVWFVAGNHGPGYTEHEYTLTRGNGDKVILDDGLKGVEGALEGIKAKVVAHLLPPLAEQYQAGQALAFGPVTIHRQNGMQMNGKLYAWADIRDVKVERGRLTLTLRDNKNHEVRASAIPNIEVMGRLIGLKFYEPSLAYS